MSSQSDDVSNPLIAQAFLEESIAWTEVTKKRPNKAKAVEAEGETEAESQGKDLLEEEED